MEMEGVPADRQARLFLDRGRLSCRKPPAAAPVFSGRLRPARPGGMRLGVRCRTGRSIDPRAAFLVSGSLVVIGDSLAWPVMPEASDDAGGPPVRLA
ncbi:MAG TPA: hypothetical protein VF096_13160, partial [Azonexus sp.]